MKKRILQLLKLLSDFFLLIITLVVFCASALTISIIPVVAIVEGLAPSVALENIHLSIIILCNAPMVYWFLYALCERFRTTAFFDNIILNWSVYGWLEFLTIGGIVIFYLIASPLLLLVSLISLLFGNFVSALWAFVSSIVPWIIILGTVNWLPGGVPMGHRTTYRSIY